MLDPRKPDPISIASVLFKRAVLAGSALSLLESAATFGSGTYTADLALRILLSIIAVDFSLCMIVAAMAVLIAQALGAAHTPRLVEYLSTIALVVLVVVAFGLRGGYEPGYLSAREWVPWTRWC
jgi:hypothetical protein